MKIHMIHATDLELNTRAFVPPFGRTKELFSLKNIRLLEKTGKTHLNLRIMNFPNHLYLTETLQFSLSWPPRSLLLLVRVKSPINKRWTHDMCFGKPHLLIHVKIHMIHIMPRTLNSTPGPLWRLPNFLSAYFHWAHLHWSLGFSLTAALTLTTKRIFNTAKFTIKW